MIAFKEESEIQLCRFYLVTFDIGGVFAVELTAEAEICYLGTLCSRKKDISRCKVIVNYLVT